MTEPVNSCELIRQMPVFGGLNDASLTFILEKSELVEQSSGTMLFEEGDPATAVFVIQKGSVKIEKSWQGAPVELRILSAGDCVGEMAILDLQPRSASVRAITDCQAIKIDRVTLHDLYRRDLEQYAIIMMNMGREVSRRLRVVSEKLFTIEQTTR